MKPEPYSASQPMEESNGYHRINPISGDLMSDAKMENEAAAFTAAVATENERLRASVVHSGLIAEGDLGMTAAVATENERLRALVGHSGLIVDGDLGMTAAVATEDERLKALVGHFGLITVGDLGMTAAVVVENEWVRALVVHSGLIAEGGLGITAADKTTDARWRFSTLIFNSDNNNLGSTSTSTDQIAAVVSMVDNLTKVANNLLHTVITYSGSGEQSGGSGPQEQEFEQ